MDEVSCYRKTKCIRADSVCCYRCVDNSNAKQDGINGLENCFYGYAEDRDFYTRH